MLLIKMSSMIVDSFTPPLNKWDKKSIRPGPVGSVGDVLTSIRIKQSSPDMPFAYDIKFNPDNDMLRGSNVQDGRWYSFSDHGFGAEVKRKKLNNFKHTVGWREQNIIPEDRTTQPKLLDQPRQGWKTQVSEILQRQGDMFTTLPGGYKPQGETPRGSQYPTKQNRFNSETVTDYEKYIKPPIAPEDMPGYMVPTKTSSILQSVVTPRDIDIPTPISRNRNRYGLNVNTDPNYYG